MGSSWLVNDHDDVDDSPLHASEATIAEATTAGKAAAGPDMIPVVIE